MQLNEEITKQIEKFATQAGLRAAARALHGGCSRQDATTAQELRANEVRKQLCSRFQETNELPADISRDIAELAKRPGLQALSDLPTVEIVDGHIAPPFIAISYDELARVIKTHAGNV